jgi:hypothetical protein
MLKPQDVKTILQESSFNIGNKQTKFLWSLVLVALLVAIIGFLVGNARLVWQALLVNTVFFGGLSLGGFMFSVIFTVTKAHWGRPLKRLSEAMTAFLPVMVLLFLILFLGIDYFFEWLDPEKVIHAKAGWLNLNFFIIRNCLVMIIFCVLAWFYIKHSIRPDLALAQKHDYFKNSIFNTVIKNYQNHDLEVEQSTRKSTVLGPIMGIAFVVISTLIAFDWMMSLDQEWFSTLFGVQYFVSNLMAGAAFLMIVSGLAREKHNLSDYISIKRYHDISKLTFSACLLWTYMIFSEVLVIWYSNLPEETPYLVMRIQSEEWRWLFWFIFVLLFVIPFFGLMGRTACNSIKFSRIIAIIVLLGAWLEKYILIIPSIQENQIDQISALKKLPGFELNFYDIFITLGIFGLFILCFSFFMKNVPSLPISDKLLFKDENH